MLPAILVGVIVFIVASSCDAACFLTVCVERKPAYEAPAIVRQGIIGEYEYVAGAEYDTYKLRGCNGELAYFHRGTPRWRVLHDLREEFPCFTGGLIRPRRERHD